ncbi:MAG: mechanosensitive ion channel domain-containing protein [Oscillospiraceae bacterium]
MLFLTNDAPDAAAAVSEAASAVGAALEDGTASTVGFFQKIFGGFSWTKLISAAILLVVCGVLIKLILKATDRMLGRSRLDKAVHPFIRTIVKLVLLFTAIMLIAGTLGVDTSSLLALLSVAGLAVSLALQNVLSNMASAVILLTTKPFQIGHFIEMGSVSGTVVKIGAICTDILTLNNQLVHVPNSEITGSTVTNYTASDKRRLEYRITASYDAPVEDVKAALLRAAEHPLRMQEMQPIARVNGYGESAIEYVLFLWIRPKDYMDVYYDVLENVKREFDAAGIEMTYPHINVHHIS